MYMVTTFPLYISGYHLHLTAQYNYVSGSISVALLFVIRQLVYFGVVFFPPNQWSEVIMVYPPPR